MGVNGLEAVGIRGDDVRELSAHARRAVAAEEDRAHVQAEGDELLVGVGERGREVQEAPGEHLDLGLRRQQRLSVRLEVAGFPDYTHFTSTS